MASRDRSCRHLLPAKGLSWPDPERLAALAPFTYTIMDAATEYDSIGPQGPTVDFVQWLDREVRLAAEPVRLRFHDLRGVKHR